MIPRILILAALLLSASAPAATLTVNPAFAGASDTNPGSAAQPLRTISRAAALAQPGDIVQISAGVYREKVTVAQSGTKEKPIRFQAARDAKVIVTGADALTGWTKDSEGVYSIPWQHRLFQGDDHNPGGSEQVFVGGVLLTKVNSLDELADGKFFVDAAHQRLLLRSTRNPDETQADRLIEGSVRSEVWMVSGADVHTKGLTFRCAANRAQQAMAQFSGIGDVVENCTFEWSNSTGASFGAADITVRQCLFADNGQQGFTANHATRLLFDGCTVQRNNVKNYPRGWEAGGDKLVFTHDAILQNSRFLANHGNGVWFDISNVNCTVRNCLIADNEDAGIFYEISYGLHASDNVIVGNGLAGTKGAWAANGGVCVSSSPGCVIERNLIAGNQQGFCFREQNRATTPIDGKNGPDVPIWNHDETIRNNLFASNRTAQVQGWFDIATERHWPRAMQTGKPAAGNAKDDLAAAYRAPKDSVPADLALEDLKITFAGNCYAMKRGEPFFIWGANWKRKQEFKDLAGLTAAMGFEDNESRILPPLQLDIAKRDFRLPTDVMNQVIHAYPQGSVPDCVSGTSHAPAATRAAVGERAQDGAAKAEGAT